MDKNIQYADTNLTELKSPTLSSKVPIEKETEANVFALGIGLMVLWIAVILSFSRPFRDVLHRLIKCNWQRHQTHSMADMEAGNVLSGASNRVNSNESDPGFGIGRHKEKMLEATEYTVPSAHTIKPKTSMGPKLSAAASKRAAMAKEKRWRQSMPNPSSLHSSSSSDIANMTPGHAPSHSRHVQYGHSINVKLPSVSQQHRNRAKVSQRNRMSQQVQRRETEPMNKPKQLDTEGSGVGVHFDGDLNGHRKSTSSHGVFDRKAGTRLMDVTNDTSE